MPAVVVGAVLLASCSSGGKSPAASDRGVTVPTSRGASRAVTVDVKAGEYFFRSPITTFKVGVKYHFVVDNVGDIEHEFMLLRPIAPGVMSMEQMDRMSMGHIEDSDLQAHHRAAVDVTFTKPYPAGALEMACHIGRHYQRGMRLPIVVTP